MSEEVKQTMTQRMSALEDRVRQMELSSVEPGASASYEDLQEIRAAVINALHGLRSQSAYKMAQALEEKYFEGADIRSVGDTVLSSQALASAGGTQKGVTHRTYDD